MTRKDTWHISAHLHFIFPSSASFSVVHTLSQCVCSDRKDTRPISKRYAIHPYADRLRHRTHIYINMSDAWPISTSISHTSMCWSTATQDPYLHRRLTHTCIDMTYISMPIDYGHVSVTSSRHTSVHPPIYIDAHMWHVSTSMYICDIYLHRYAIHLCADRLWASTACSWKTCVC